MPTEKQIRDAVEVVTKLCPGARIVRVGPDGVEFDYPDEAKSPKKLEPLGRSQ